MPISFLSPSPVSGSFFFYKISPFSPSFRSKRPCNVTLSKHACRVRLSPTASQSNWTKRSSSAINQEDDANQYIDLHTMKLIRSEEANLSYSPDPKLSFGVLTNHELFLNSTQRLKLRQLLFTDDTVPLSEPQKDVVQALFSRRSVFYNTNDGTDKEAIFVDIVMRTRLWKQCVVYCADSRRSAESTYAMICAQLGPERRNEVMFDYGDGTPSLMDEEFTSLDKIRVVITSPSVLRNQFVQANEVNGWLANVSMIFIDNLNSTTLTEWEEVILSVPSKILLCVFTREFNRQQRELLPLWIESVQNSLVNVNPLGGYSVLDRIDRPQNCPLLRIFAYNAATHEAPVQVSLTLLKEMYEKELKGSETSFVPDYAECFLKGITMIPAENPKNFLFRNRKEATYADLCSLIVADAERTKSKMEGKNKKRARNTKRKERTAHSRAAARRRRESALADSNLFPAISMVNGEEDARFAAAAIESALMDRTDLHWDDDSRDHLEEIILDYKETHQKQLSQMDEEILKTLSHGIGILTSTVTPAIQVIIQETFRGGLIPLLIVDTHLGSQELSSLPHAKTVLVDSAALAICDDNRKGFIMASTVASLAGREGKDDVGSMVVLWYDESIDDEAAGSEVASNLLERLYNDGDKLFGSTARTTSAQTLLRKQQNSFELQGRSRNVQNKPATLSSTYSGILRSLRRFGIDGSESIIDYTVDAYNGWLERAALHATLEKMQLEQQAMTEAIQNENWETIADYERKQAKVNECKRIFDAMKVRYDSVFITRLLEELRTSKPGRVLGVVRPEDESASSPLERKLLEPASSKSDDSDENDLLSLSNSNLEISEQTKVKRETLAAAVYVTILGGSHENNEQKDSILKARVVCILADGMWTSLPVSDVVSMAAESEEIVENVDLLTVPHPATFDLDPDSNWSKCNPIDETERSTVHRISDDLIGLVTGTKRVRMTRYKIVEFENQKEKVEIAEDLCQQSPWFGRNEEILELRRIRRRSAEIGEKIKTLERRELQLEEILFNEHAAELTNKSSLMAVLEDCHAVAVGGNEAMQLTPIGSLGSILPNAYPIFSAACLCLVDGIESLSPSELAAFVALIVCSVPDWTQANLSSFPTSNIGEVNTLQVEDENDDVLDLSILHQKNSNDEEDDNETSEDNADFEVLHSVLPSAIQIAIKEIQHALRQLHERHLGDKHKMQGKLSSDVVPPRLNVDITVAIKSFVEGHDWGMIMKEMNYNSTHTITEFRRVKCVLNLIAQNGGGSEFSKNVQETAKQAYQSLNKWPVESKETILKLVEDGVVEKQWSGNTYEKWWRSTKENISLLNDQGANMNQNNIIEIAEAEIMES